MMLPLILSAALLLPSVVNAITAFQEKSYNFSVPSTPRANFNATTFTTADDALTSLQEALGPNVTIAYPGSVSYGSTIARIWTEQRKTYPQAIVYPKTPEDVSIVMQFYSHAYGVWGDVGFAVMCGGHADFGGAQSTSVVIDMQNLDSAEIALEPPANSSDYAILKIGGGSKGGHVYDKLQGTGWAFLGPRASTIGAGGCTLGGCLAFQTSKYGTGVDNLVGAEVVLVNGTIVYASPENEYSDLFWSLTGAGWIGVGVVTHFYSRANPDPGMVVVGTFAFGEAKALEVFEKATDIFEHNTDPDAFPALLYYYKKPSLVSGVAPLVDRQFTVQMDCFYYGSWEKFNQSFGAFYENADGISLQTYTLQTLQQYLQANYPYGYNRFFYGKSHTNVSMEFWNNTFAIYKETINGMMARGEDPGNTLWVSEYMFPKWNGKGPVTDSDTAWPHSTSAHVTLTSPEYSNASNTEYLYERDQVMMNYLRDYQNSLDMPPIYDYPNYIAPYSNATEVWGTENFNRLVKIKEKYDPYCLLNRGKVFPTTACVEKGVANIYLE